jgi:predicted ATPase
MRSTWSARTRSTIRLIGSLAGRAGSNPLFAEQYAQMLADHAAGPELAMSELVVPESVQGIIAARLDLLAPEEKRLLHDAAVIGRCSGPARSLHSAA